MDIGLKKEKRLFLSERTSKKKLHARILVLAVESFISVSPYSTCNGPGGQKFTFRKPMVGSKMGTESRGEIVPD